MTETTTRPTTDDADDTTAAAEMAATDATASPTDDRAPLSTADIARGGAPTDREDAASESAPAPATASAAAPASTTSATPDERHEPLFDTDANTDLRGRWTDIQAGFVDEPRRSVEQADGLVAEVMQRLADTFAKERQGLERQWSQGEDASTEDLRVALRRYRTFFDRLLAM